MSTTDPPGGFRQHRFTAPAAATTVLLVRHGESAAADPARPFALRDGHGDPPLHPDGRVQAELLAARLSAEHHAGRPIDAIVVTSLIRTAQTAAPLASRLGLTPIVERDLREVYLGDWEGGLLRERIAVCDPLLTRLISEERWDVIPGAEPLDRFDAAVTTALGRLVGAHPGHRVVVVCHGGVIGHLLHRATGSRRFAFAGADNASISEIVISGEHQTVRRFNDHSHLDDQPSGR